MAFVHWPQVSQYANTIIHNHPPSTHFHSYTHVTVPHAQRICECVWYLHSTIVEGHTIQHHYHHFLTHSFIPHITQPSNVIPWQSTPLSFGDCMVGMLPDGYLMKDYKRYFGRKNDSEVFISFHELFKEGCVLEWKEHKSLNHTTKWAWVALCCFGIAHF